MADTLNTLRERTSSVQSAEWKINNMHRLLQTSANDMYTNIMTLGIDELHGLSRDNLALINSLREVDQRNNDRETASARTSSSSSIQRHIFTDAEIEERFKK